MLDKYGKLLLSYINDNSLTVHCVVGAVSLYAFYRLVIKKKYKLPPGPRGLPLLGNLTSFRDKTVFEKLIEWQKVYGDIITIYLGPQRTVVINDIDLLLDAFVNQSREFSDRPFLYSLDIFSEGSKSILASRLGDTLKYQRKVASQSLRHYLTGKQFEERCHEVIQYSSKVIESQNGPFLMKDIFSLCVVNIMHGLCFGSTKEFDDESFREIVNFLQYFNDQVGNGFLEDLFPPLRYWPSKKFTNLTGRFLWFIEYIQKRVDERRAEVDKASPRCLADSIIVAQQELLEADSASFKHMTDVHARQIVSDVFGAGVDTSRITLDWMFLVLITKPDIQARMQKEIDEVVGEKIPGKEHRAKLVYTEAVILEVMRYYAVAPLGVPHETRSDSIIGGYEIPAKTIIMINQFLILRDPKHWDDPLTFKPERFISADGTKVVLRNRSFVPFSVGPRACPGESLAKLEIVYLVVGLLQKFTFSLAPGEKADFTPDTSFFAYRAADYKVVAQPR